MREYVVVAIFTFLGVEGALCFENLHFCGVEGALRFEILRLSAVEGTLDFETLYFFGSSSV